MAQKNKVQFREFLNTLEHGGTAYVRFTVHYKRSSVAAYFTIKDCSNEATLEFRMSKAKDATNALAKLAMLKRAVTEFEQAYLAALEKHKAYLKAKKAKKEKGG